MRIESGSLEITGLLDPDSPHCSSTAGFEKIHGRLCCGEESEGSVSNRRAAGAAGQILPEAAHGGNTLLPLTPGSPQVILTCNTCSLVLNGPSWTSYRTSSDVTSAGRSPCVLAVNMRSRVMVSPSGQHFGGIWRIQS